MIDPILKVILILVPQLSAEGRVTLEHHLTGRVRRRPDMGDLPDVVTAAVEAGNERAAAVAAAVAERRPEATRKQVYNTLAYLARRGEVRRLGYGHYRARPTPPLRTEGEG